MSGRPQIEIKESVKELRALLKQQKTALNHAKVQALYLLKIEATETVRYLAVMMGRSESTIHYWLQLYRLGGLDKLLEQHPKTGRPKKLKIETVAKLQQELSQPEGFKSYGEIQHWLLACQDLRLSYPTVHRVVRYELTGKLKVPRPYHEYQKPGVVAAFRQHFPTRIQGVIAEIRKQWGRRVPVTYWCQDETRLGFRTDLTRQITRQGIKPEQVLQWHYDYYYLYGLVAPITGRSFFYEFSHFNAQCLEIFLEKFAHAHPEEVHIIQLDNAPAHRAKTLTVPENIILLFQPPYCPELNPIERVWQHLKKDLKNLSFLHLDELRERVANLLDQFSEEVIYSLTGWNYLTEALSL
jgi:transposase